MGQQDRRSGRKRKKEENRTNEDSDDSRRDLKSPKKKTRKRKENEKKDKSSDESSQEHFNQSQNSTSADEVALHPEEGDEFSNGDSSKGTSVSSQDSNQMVENDEVEQYTITEVPEEGQKVDSEVEFNTQAKNPEKERQNQMMHDIGEFFNDSAKLDRVWNLVKAINASDQIEKQKKARESEKEVSPKEKERPAYEGNRSNIDASKLITRERSETTIYEVANPGLEESEIEMPFSSPDMTSSDEAISPIDFPGGRDKGTEGPPRRLLLPLLPPPREEQPGTSTGGWTGSGSDRVRRTKQRMADEVNEANKLKSNPVKPPGKNITMFDNNKSQQIISELLSKGSDVSIIADTLSALTTEADFDPLEVQLDSLTLQKIKQGGYVDLRKLLPRETIGDDAEEDDLHWVLQDGTPKLRRKNSVDLLAINGYRRWMTAFTAYSRIYAKEHPDRAAEMHQYILDIQDASNTYTWDSVYKYDKIFRMYMERKPWHDWGTPYTKYWNKTLKKRDRDNFSPRTPGYAGNKQVRKVCWKFNKFGRCDRGKDCECDHRCKFCGKFGHHKGICYFNRDNKDSRDEHEGSNEAAGRVKKGKKEH